MTVSIGVRVHVRARIKYIVNASGFGSRPKMSYHKPGMISMLYVLGGCLTHLELVHAVTASTREQEFVAVQLSQPCLGSNGAFLNTGAYLAEANTSQ